MRQRTEYREVDERTKTEQFTIKAPWIYAPPAPPSPGADPADSSSDVAAALLELGRAQQKLAELNDRLAEGDDQALAEIRGAEDQVRLATARFGKQRQLARGAREREAEGIKEQMLELIRQAAGYEPEIERLYQRVLADVDALNQAISRSTACMDRANALGRGVSDVYRNGEGGVGWDLPQMGGGAFVGAEGYCRHAKVELARHFARYTPPAFLAGPPAAELPAEQCPSHLAASRGGWHVLADERVQRGGVVITTGRQQCVHCKKVFERGAIVPMSGAA